jgi:hypothetical protein
MPEATGTFAPFVIARKLPTTTHPGIPCFGGEPRHPATAFQARAAR